MQIQSVPLPQMFPTKDCSTQKGFCQTCFPPCALVQFPTLRACPRLTQKKTHFHTFTRFARPSKRQDSKAIDGSRPSHNKKAKLPVQATSLLSVCLVVCFCQTSLHRRNSFTAKAANNTVFKHRSVVSSRSKFPLQHAPKSAFAKSASSKPLSRSIRQDGLPVEF